MEKKILGDGEKREKELNKLYVHHRPLSNCTSADYQIKTDRSARWTIIDDNERRYPPVILPSERPHMKSSTLPQYKSNPSLIDRNKTTIVNDNHVTSLTNSFRTKTNQLHHAKSHSELYQTNTTSIQSTRINNNSNETGVKHASQLTDSMPIQTATSQIKQTNQSQKVPLWKRFKKLIIPSKRNKDRQNLSTKVPALLLDESPSSELNQTEVDSKSMVLLQNPIKVSELKSWVSSKTFPEQRIRDEFSSLPTEPLFPKTIGNLQENKIKNRFNSIEPYDHSRVILKKLPNDLTSDYINASYIDGYENKKIYIAAQAPTDTTLYDFIRMIWQLRIQSIIMLTRLFEDGKHKCHQYWPDEGDKQINHFRIQIDSEEKYSYYVIRRFTLHNQIESSEDLIVKQFHFLSWPDHDCLSLPTPLLEFRQRFRTDLKSSNPILVHCSAGVGRSGTFIALDALLEAAKFQDRIDVLEFTHRMRQNRVHMIQTVDQYVFLYRTLIEGILTMNTHIKLQEFMSTRKLHMDIKDQFKLLEQLQANIEYSYRSALDSNNMNKNRFESILAPDNCRPYLMTQVEKTTDYINAVFVNSYRQLSNYVVTQYPLPHTIIDFWRLIYDHNLSIIMLIESIPKDPKNVPYWPSNISETVSYGPLDIVLLSQKEDDHLFERVLELKYTQKTFTNERARTVRQFQVKDNTRLLPIVKRFLKEMRTRAEQNVLIQCLNGSTWSGYFSALCNSIDKMQTEQIIDPFTVVRLIRANRKQFIDQNQYENLFISMIDYAQQYLSIGQSLNRPVENSVYMNASVVHDQSSANKR